VYDGTTVLETCGELLTGFLVWNTELGTVNNVLRSTCRFWLVQFIIVYFSFTDLLIAGFYYSILSLLFIVNYNRIVH